VSQNAQLPLREVWFTQFMMCEGGVKQELVEQVVPLIKRKTEPAVSRSRKLKEPSVKPNRESQETLQKANAHEVISWVLLCSAFAIPDGKLWSFRLLP